MDYVWPTNAVEVTSGPDGNIITVADAAMYLGGIDSVAAGQPLQDAVQQATDMVDGPLSATGTSFRARSLRVTVTLGYGIFPVRLPGGSARNVTVTKDGEAFTGFEVSQLDQHNTLVMLGEAGTYTISYDVGYSEIPQLAKLAVSRVLFSLWNRPQADSGSSLITEVRNLLFRHLAIGDWD